MSSSNRAPNEGAVNNLPGVTTHLTGHDDDGKAIVESSRPGKWTAFEDNQMGFNVVYTNKFPPDLNDNKDIAQHDELMEKGQIGLVLGGGTVCRMVDFAPGYECIMHRTQSLDFGIVLEGSIEMRLDSGSKTLMERGDVAVQRGTMHSWKNPSDTEWCRMCFVLQDSQKLKVAGKEYGEDLGRGTEGIPPSGN